MGGRSSKTNNRQPTSDLTKERTVPTLSESDYSAMSDYYDVIVVGSGYGGGIAASRAARAGKSVCILERGEEWKPGDFPEDGIGAMKTVQLKRKGHSISGNKLGLFDLIVSDDVTVVIGCGLGGTSLINANVALEASPHVFQDDVWPREFQEDMENFKNDIERAKLTLQPQVYPLDTAKAKELRKAANKIKSLTDIEDLGDLFKNIHDKPIDQLHYKTPIYVTTHNRHVVSNKFGVPQPACNGCGNCVGGCNTGAKNTLNMNFLPDAKYHGAQIFTKVKVIKVKQIHEDGSWQVFYQRFRKDDFENEVHTVRASIVILGAGCLGSTEILHRSKDDGLSISDMIGKGFSSNGDQIGFSWTNDERSNSFGLPSDYSIDPQSYAPGPMVTSILDLRQDTVPYHQHLILTDGAAHTAIAPLVKAIMYIASPLFSHDSDPDDDWEQFVDRLTGNALNNTLPLLAMSHDDVDKDGKITTGQIVLDNDGVKIEWKNAGERPNYHNVNTACKLTAKALGGTFIENPAWSSRLRPFFNGRNTVTVHPLGGCNMGESGLDGVVNHKGQVFEGNSNQCFSGLYVMDGSIVPHSLGVNPSLTISGVAERCMRLMAKDYNWSINYEFVEHPANITWETSSKPDVRNAAKKSGNCSII